ncbi:MAG: sulfatase [Planctomycetota bacterium]
MFTFRPLLLRLGASLAIFDVVQTVFGAGGAVEGLPMYLAAIFMPFGLFGLVYLALSKLPQSKIVYAIGVVLVLIRHAFFLQPMLAGRDVPQSFGLYFFGLACALTIIFVPWKPMQKVWKILCPAAIIPGLLGMFLMVNKEDQATQLDAPSVAAAKGVPNLVLISWDTVRADVLPMYGGTELPMPNLSAFAARSLTFEDAVAVTPITGPEHASMLTGVYPPSHGLRANMLGLAPHGPTTLAEQLRDAGYRTGGFIAAFPLVARFGFAQGFEHFDDRLLGNPLLNLRRFRFADAGWINSFDRLIPHSPTAYTHGPEVQRRAMDWLQTIPADDPYFLFLHLYDAHAPYAPTEPYLAAAKAAQGIAQPTSFDPNDADAMARYRGEIAMLDDYLAEILEALEERDPGLKNTVVLLTADHGECFGEGDIYHDHVPSLYEVTQHVPLILHLPGDLGAGTRVSQTVAHLDIVPTFLAAAGIERPESLDHIQSYALQGALNDDFATDNRTIYMEAQQFKLGKARKQGWRTQEWKLVQWDGGHQDLWKFRENETENFAQQMPKLLEGLLLAMQDFFDDLPQATGDVVELSAMNMDQMGQLGYTGDSGEEGE